MGDLLARQVPSSARLEGNHKERVLDGTDMYCRAPALPKINKSPPHLKVTLLLLPLHFTVSLSLSLPSLTFTLSLPAHHPHSSSSSSPSPFPSTSCPSVADLKSTMQIDEEPDFRRHEVSAAVQEETPAASYPVNQHASHSSIQEHLQVLETEQGGAQGGNRERPSRSASAKSLIVDMRHTQLLGPKKMQASGGVQEESSIRSLRSSLGAGSSYGGQLPSPAGAVARMPLRSSPTSIRWVCFVYVV